MKKVLVISLLGLMSTQLYAAGDAAAGKTKVETICAACHGADGHSAVDLYPNLAGQKETYIVKQLKAFKSGDRKDPVMSPMAAPLSDEDIANVAAYLSTLK